MEDKLLNLINRYEKVKQSIIATSKKSFFKSKVNLIVVAKGRTKIEIEALINQGQIDFAENYINSETMINWGYLKNKYPQIKVHFIGHIQTNKLNKILQIADFIHSIDSMNIIDYFIKKEINNKKCFLQIKFDEGENRSGVFYKNIEEYILYCKKNKFNIDGFMVVLPKICDVNLVFSFVKSLSFKYKLNDLSMGMTEDYVEAILNGANYVRVGRKIFEGC
jgi:pyridoxal phosphate enzyme (YggS family)